MEGPNGTTNDTMHDTDELGLCQNRFLHVNSAWDARYQIYYVDHAVSKLLCLHAIRRELNS
jgi:hypothetical protein